MLYDARSQERRKECRKANDVFSFHVPLETRQLGEIYLLPQSPGNESAVEAEAV